MTSNNINVSINFFSNKNKRNKNKSINAPLESCYSSKILKVMRVGGVRVKIEKNFVLDEFTDYTVAHQVSEHNYKVDFHSKDIEACVEYVMNLNQTVFNAVNDIIGNFSKIEKSRESYEKIKTRKAKMAYPNE